MGKGTRFKDVFGGTYPDNRDIQYIPIHVLISRSLRAPMTQESAIILLNWRPQFLIIGGEGAKKKYQALGLNLIPEPQSPWTPESLIPESRSLIRRP